MPLRSLRELDRIGRGEQSEPQLSFDLLPRDRSFLLDLGEGLPCLREIRLIFEPLQNGQILEGYKSSDFPSFVPYDDSLFLLRYPCDQIPISTQRCALGHLTSRSSADQPGRRSPLILL